MAVVMRLTRTGKRNIPYFRLVVAEKHFPRNGRFIERLGFYDPHNKEKVKLQEEKILGWLKRGAKPSDTVKSLLVKAGIWSRFSEEKKA